MKKIHKLIIFACFTLLSTSESNILARQQKPMGANPYTYSPQLFNAEHEITGRYWAGNKQYPGKAYIDEIEYTKIIVIQKKTLNTKSNKKLRTNKDYLGSYINAQDDQEYCLYGVKKYPDSGNNGPDADVLTQIAIELDYGIGE